MSKKYFSKAFRQTSPSFQEEAVGYNESFEEDDRRQDISELSEATLKHLTSSSRFFGVLDRVKS